MGPLDYLSKAFSGSGLISGTNMDIPRPETPVLNPLELLSRVYSAATRPSPPQLSSAGYLEPGTPGYSREALRTQEAERQRKAAEWDAQQRAGGAWTDQGAPTPGFLQTPEQKMVYDSVSTILGPMNATQFGAAMLSGGGLKGTVNSGRSTVRSFINENSPIANLEMKAEAQRMLKAGFPAELILKETGWSKRHGAWVEQIADKIALKPNVKEYLDKLTALITEPPPHKYGPTMTRAEREANMAWSAEHSAKIEALRNAVPEGFKWSTSRATGTQMQGRLGDAVDWEGGMQAHPNMPDVSVGFAYPRTPSEEAAKSAKTYGGFARPNGRGTLLQGGPDNTEYGQIFGLHPFAEIGTNMEKGYLGPIVHEGNHALANFLGMEPGANLGQYTDDFLEAEARGILRSNPRVNLTDEQLKDPEAVRSAVNALGGRIAGRTTAQFLDALGGRGKSAYQKYMDSTGELTAWSAGRDFNKPLSELRDNPYWMHRNYRAYASPEKIPGSGATGTKFDIYDALDLEGNGLNTPADRAALMGHNRGPALMASEGAGVPAPDMTEAQLEKELKRMGEGGSNKGTVPPVTRSATRFRGGRERSEYPGIYGNPADIVKDVRVSPEDPALRELWGVTREDLTNIGATRASTVGKGNAMNANGGPPLEPWVPPATPERGRGSRAAQRIMTPSNERRIGNILDAAQNTPGLRDMQGWYVMDPLYQRMVQLLGPEKAAERFNMLHGLTSLASPGSPVDWEINRGSAADWLNNQGRFQEFKDRGGMKGGGRVSFPDDPELAFMKPHPYHSTSQAKPMEGFLATGSTGDAAKVAAYEKAGRPPELGMQSNYAVGDAHWARGVGLADTRTNKAYAQSVSLPEMNTLWPWYQEIAARQGIQSVPAQALQWGALARQTGVNTPIGAGKLELISQAIMKTAERTGRPPTEVRDLYLTGKLPIGSIDPTLLAAMGGVSGVTALLGALAKKTQESGQEGGE